MIRRFFRAVAFAWRRRRDVYVTESWIAQQEREELKAGQVGVAWRWPFRAEHDMNGPRNSWLLRRHE